MASPIALIPAYEPSDSLPALAARLHMQGFDTVVVDDGSGEKYGPVFEETGRFAKVLAHGANRGKGRALKTGLRYILENRPEKTVVVTLDADGQHRPEDAVRVSRAAVENPGCLVLGSRSFGKNVPARSLFGNTVTRFVYRLSTGAAVRDTQTGLRAFGTGMIPLLLRIGGERYEYEMNVLLACAGQGIPIREVDIETLYFDNNAGSHFDTVRDSFRVYREILKFAASSFTGFLVDYGLYSLLVLLTGGLGAALSMPLSNITARCVSASVNFAVNRRFVFKSRDGLARTAAGYFALAACVLLGNTLLLSGLTEGLGVNKFAAKLAAELAFFTLSWLVQRLVIFKKRGPDKSGPGKAAGNEN